MLPRLTRRRFVLGTGLGVLGVGGYFGWQAVRRVREAAARSVSQ